MILELIANKTTEPLGPRGRVVARSAHLLLGARRLPCLIHGHDFETWAQCPSVAMCRWCHTSHVETEASR